MKRGDYQSVAHLVPDEMVRTFVAVGEPDKVRERIERAWTVADSIGIARSNAASFSASEHGMRNAMRSTSRATRARWATDETKPTDFFTDVTDARTGRLKGDRTSGDKRRTTTASPRL